MAQTGQYGIRYDILNGHDLSFSDESGLKGVPYIQKPFSPFPISYPSLPKKFINEKNGVSKRQRPYLFWAAMQLAQPDEQGKQHSVLISITQHVGGYAEDFLYVLDKTLAGRQLPVFFRPPTDSYHQNLFEKCLSACADYFGINSNEYQLLKKGVVVHHGSMPGLLARLLVELIQKQIIHIALATSTLSEGVNLPFETVIIPTLLRNGDPMPVAEFKNLVGRAGRPGWGTEGRTLVFLESGSRDYSSRSARDNYLHVINRLKKVEKPEKNTSVLSPLGALMDYMETAWAQVSESSSVLDFMDWLERTVPLKDPAEGSKLAAEEALDSLDGFLLTVLVEQEMMTDQPIESNDLEQYLIDVWRKTYAHYVMNQVEHWEKVFATRGQAVQEKIYPHVDTRRRLYRTSVAPRYGKRILDGYPVIKEHLVTGTNYPDWSIEERTLYIIETVKLISNLGKFKVPDIYGKGKDAPAWDEILTWWLNPTGSLRSPDKNKVADWVKFVKTQYEYKFNWGLGTVLALILDDVNEELLQETSIDDWPKTGLPWIVFWLKELINWGTLDPVAALLLAHGVEYTRSAAEMKARDYYSTCTDISGDEILNPTRIKEWADQFIEKRFSISSEFHTKEISVILSRDFTKASISEWRVVPITSGDSILWIDPAGYELATSKVPHRWGANMESTYDFVLEVRSSTVKLSRFL